MTEDALNSSAPISHLAGWQVDHRSRTLHKQNSTLHFDANQFAVLLLLAEHAPQTITKDELLEKVWHGKVVTEDSIYVVINGLRRIFSDNAKHPQFIATVSGKGYQWIAEVRREIPSKDKKRWVAASAVSLSVILFVMAAFWFFRPTPPELSPTALETFQRANYLMTHSPEYHDEAIGIYQSLIDQYPDFAEAHVKLSAAMMTNIFNSDTRIVEKKRWIEQHLLKALALNPQHLEAHKLLGNLYFLIFHQHDKAKIHFEQAQGVADAHYFYSQFLLAMGEFEAAHHQLEQYIALHPQGYSSEGAAWVYTMAGNYPRARLELKKLKEFSADSYYYVVSQQAIAELSGEDKTAFEILLQLIEKAGYNQTDRDTLQSEFDTNGLQGVYHWLAFRDPQQLYIGQYSPPLSLARYAIVAGEHDAALDWLEMAYQQGRIELLWLVADPKYRPLVNEPRFISLVEKLNLSPALQLLKNI
nr:winged helix-turn-helix domain-containing protein [Vibrio mimicus]